MWACLCLYVPILLTDFVVHNEIMYFVGAMNDHDLTNSTEMYNPSTNEWKQLPGFTTSTRSRIRLGMVEYNIPGKHNYFEETIYVPQLI